MKYWQNVPLEYTAKKIFFRPSLYVVFFCLMMGLKPALAQKARIFGSIMTAKGEPVPFASVAVYQSLSGPPVTGMASDSTGQFVLEVKPGQYILKITFLSFKPYTQKLSLSKGENKKLGTIYLKPTTMSLNELTVEGERSRMQLSFAKRVYTVGKDITSIGGSVLDVLNNVPSVATDFKGNISLRGSNSVKILINGKPSIIYTNGSKALASLPANQIKEIQVITNPSAKYSAEGTAGIINIILKKNKAHNFNGSVNAMQRYPEATQVTANLNYKPGAVNWFLKGNIAHFNDPSHSRTYQRFNSPDTAYVYRKISNGNETDYHGNLTLGAAWHLTKQQTLTAKAGLFFEDKKDIFNGAFIGSTLGGKFLNRINRHTVVGGGEAGRQVSLVYKNQLNGEDNTLSASVNYEFFQAKELPHIYESSVQTPADTAFHVIKSIRKGRVLRLETNYVSPVADSGQVEAGLNSTFNWNDNDYSTQVREGGQLAPLPTFNHNYVVYENNNAAYATFSSYFGDAFSYQLGLRVEQYHIQAKLKKSTADIQQTYSNLFPSAFLTYHINEDRSLQISYSRRIRRPYARLLLPTLSYSDTRRRFTGNPDLKPEYINSYELQFLQYWETGSMLISTYYRHRNDKIVRIQTLNKQGIFLITPINLSTAEAWGIEFSASKSFTNSLKLSASANLFRSNSNGVYQGILYQTATNRFTGRLGFNWEILSGLKYQAYVRYYGPEKTIQGRRASTAFVNMAIAKDLFDGKATISVSSEDLFNTRRSKFTITNPHFFSRQKYWEPSGIRLNFIYRINQEE